MANFRKGAEAAQAASKSGNWAKTQFLKLDDNQQVIVRFITDAADWITVDQHQMIPTKPKPDGWEGNWPEKMGAVCRKDEAFNYGECYICDFVVDGKRVRAPSSRTWALACLREEVKENNQIVGYKDETRKVTRKQGDKEEEVEEKAIVVVNMAWRNFFSTLKSLAEFYGGTVLDRDFVIKRSGSDQSTTYTIIGLDPLYFEMDGENVKFDLRDPRFQTRYETDLDLEQVVAERADDDFYARFFDPRFTPSKEGNKVEETGKTPDVPKPSTDVDDEDRLAALAQRVQSYGQGEANGQPAPAPAVAPAAAGAPRDLG